MTTYFTAAAVVCLLLTGFASLMDWRRGNRDDLDRVGWVNWPLMLILSIVAALIFGMLAFVA